MMANMRAETCFTGDYEINQLANEIESRLTALISENYYPKEFTEWVMSELAKNNFGIYVHYVTKKGMAGVIELEFDTMDEAFNYWKENYK